MIYLIACISSYLSGLGIGGGASFIILVLLFNLLNINEARAYNLLLFISTGLVIFFKNFKKEKIYKSIIIYNNRVCNRNDFK